MSTENALAICTANGVRNSAACQWLYSEHIESGAINPAQLLQKRMLVVKNKNERQAWQWLVSSSKTCAYCDKVLPLVKVVASLCQCD